MTNIEDIVKETIDKMGDDGKLKQMVQEKVSGAVEEAMSRAFSSYSGFTKTIEKAIEEQIKVDLSDLMMPGYNDIVLKVLRQQLDGYFSEQVSKDIKGRLDQLLSDFPKSITVSELADKFREYCREDESEEDLYGDNRFTMKIERDEGDLCSDYWDIYLDKEEDQDRWRCKYHIRIREEGIWAVSIGDTQVHKRLFIGPIFGFERFLFHAYTHTIQVKCDTVDPDTFYGNDY